MLYDLYHGNQAEKVFIALFYEQSDHQENFNFIRCKIILIFARLCGEFSHYCNFGAPKGAWPKSRRASRAFCPTLLQFLQPPMFGITAVYYMYVHVNINLVFGEEGAVYILLQLKKLNLYPRIDKFTFIL